jgi:hypothetical protein
MQAWLGVCPLGVDKQADEFVAKLKEQLGAVAVNVVK